MNEIFQLAIKYPSPMLCTTLIQLKIQHVIGIIRTISRKNLGT